MQKHFSQINLGLLICAIAAINAYANYEHLYFFIWWIDIPMHILGGFWVALFSLAFYYRAKFPKTKDTTALFVVVFAVAITMIIGLCWELFEFSAQTLIERADVHDLEDTLADLVNDFIGAVLATLLFVRMGYNKKI